MIEFYPHYGRYTLIHGCMHIVYADAIIYHNGILNLNAFSSPYTLTNCGCVEKVFRFLSFHPFLRGAVKCISVSLDTSITLSVYLSLTCKNVIAQIW